MDWTSNSHNGAVKRRLIQAGLSLALVLGLAGMASAGLSSTGEPLSGETLAVPGVAPGSETAAGGTGLARIAEECQRFPAGEPAPDGIRLALVQSGSRITMLESSARRKSAGAAGELELRVNVGHTSRLGNGVPESGGTASPTVIPVTVRATVDPLLLSLGDREWGGNF
jgi:hypothetical protein